MDHRKGSQFAGRLSMVAALSSSEPKFGLMSCGRWSVQITTSHLVCLHLDLRHLGGPGHPVPGHRHLHQQVREVTGGVGGLEHAAFTYRARGV